MACFTAVSRCASQGLTNPNNRFANFVNKVEKRDKILKLIVSTVDLAHHYAKQEGASSEVTEGLEGTSWGLRYVRDGFGFFNVLGGSIPRMVGGVQKIRAAAASLFSQEEYVVGRTTHRGTVEKGLGLTKHFASFVSEASFTGAFGVARPVSFIEKTSQITDMRYGNPIDPMPLGASAHSLGKTFRPFMFVNHAASIVGSVASMVLQGMFYSRGENEFAGEWNHTFFDYVGSIAKQIIKFLKNVLDLVVDISALFLKVPLHPTITLSFTFVASLLSVYSLWRDTPAG